MSLGPLSEIVSMAVPSSAERLARMTASSVPAVASAAFLRRLLMRSSISSASARIVTPGSMRLETSSPRVAQNCAIAFSARSERDVGTGWAGCLAKLLTWSMMSEAFVLWESILASTVLKTSGSVEPPWAMVRERPRA